MKLTKEQRFVAYVIMLHEAKNNKWEGFGLCHLIFFTFGIVDEGYAKKYQEVNKYGDVLKYFPELLSKKPSDGWPKWDILGWQQRKEFIKQCINETA